MNILSFYVAQRRVLTVFFIMESSFGKSWFSTTKTETVIRSILGAVRADIRPLAYTVGAAINLMFVQKISMDDIYVMDDIYPDVAKRVKNRHGKPSSPKTVSRRVERLANLCWDTLVARNLVLEYLGVPLKNIRAPRDMIFYLAFYVYLDTLFFVAIQKQPALLF